MVDKYRMSPFYRARTQYHHYSDSVDSEWQLEVYLYALGLMKKNGYRSIVDLGCGAGNKLITYFEDYDTLGLELPINVEILRKRYPERKWEVCDLSVKPSITTDVIVCADVIEHLVDPDQLLEYLKNVSFQYLVISTPDRYLVYRPWQKGYFGPPKNKAHVREWSFREFGEYIAAHFEIVDHRISDMRQCTQMVICRPQIA